MATTRANTWCEDSLTYLLLEDDIYSEQDRSYCAGTISTGKSYLRILQSPDTEESVFYCSHKKGSVM